MLKKLRENKKGFTLAELLIVVAIIGVLVAVSIPIFTSQLKKARLATNQANARSAHAALVAEMLAGSSDAVASGSDTYTVSTGSLTGTVGTATAGEVDSDPSEWKVDTETGVDGTAMGDKTATSWYVSIDDSGKVTYTPSFS